MAHSYAYYSSAAAAAAAAYNALKDSGYFDNNGVTLDDSTNTITCVKDAETLLTIQYSSRRLDWTFGLYTSYATEATSFTVAVCDSAVYLGFTGYGGSLYTIAVYKSVKGRIMFTFKNAYGGELKTASDDMAEAPSNGNGTVTANASYSTACLLCSSNGTVDAVSVSKDVYRFVDKYTSVTTTGLSVTQIGDETYLTDGFLCMKTT